MYNSIPHITLSFLVFDTIHPTVNELKTKKILNLEIAQFEKVIIEQFDQLHIILSQLNLQNRIFMVYFIGISLI